MISPQNSGIPQQILDDLEAANEHAAQAWALYRRAEERAEGWRCLFWIMFTVAVGCLTGVMIMGMKP